MNTTNDIRPTLSRWGNAQRQALRVSSEMTRSQRARSAQTNEDAVLLCILATMKPKPSSVDAIARSSGLSARAVGDALADIEQVGGIENGTRATGRVGILTPAVLDALGLGKYSRAADFVRLDVRASGSGAELSDDALTAAFLVSA